MGLKTSIILGLSLLLCASFSAQAQPCPPHTPLTYGFEDLIIQARVYGTVDRRGELSKLGKTLKLGDQKFSQKELDQIRGAVGVLYCKAYGTFPPMAETAFLIGNNREITTASHGLVDDWGTKRDLSTCYFENFDIPPKRRELLTQSPRNIISSQIRINDQREDRARLVLKTAMDDVRPLAPDLSGKKLPKGTPTVLVAAQHEDFKTSGIDPILSPCFVQDYYDPGDGLSRMKTDCDSAKGSSGGVYLIRGDDGKLYAKAMQVSSREGNYSTKPNNSPYDSESNYVKALVIDQSFLGWYLK